MAENKEDGIAKRWLKNLFGPDKPEEPGMESLDEKTSEILNKGTEEAGKGIYQEIKGYTPDKIDAVVFVDPKLLEDDAKDKIVEKPQTSQAKNQSVIDDDTFDNLEREEEQLDNQDRETRQQG